MINKKNLEIKNLSTMSVFENLYDGIQDGTAFFINAPIWDSKQNALAAEYSPQLFPGKEDQVQQGTFVNSAGEVYKWVRLMNEKVKSNVLIFENIEDYCQARILKCFGDRFL
jgi:hypothetical protein